jgi:adenine-specific DNA-methyltransferase
MAVNVLIPRDVISDAYRRLPVTRTDMERFKAALTHLLDRINTEESEENCKNLVRDFLLQAWYAGKHEVNTKGRTDLVIHHEANAQSEVAVIIEAKRPTNTAEMPTEAAPNSKTLHELLLYYFREREAGNLRIKHLVATNGYQWHLLDERQWDKRFYRNKSLLKQYREWAADNRDTAWFYTNIARPAIAANLDGMDWVFVDIREYEDALRNASKADDIKLINLYKLLSPSHLLRQPFANDSNSLAQPFYAELLHLIGLEEVRDKGRKLIQRKEAGQRQTASLLENTIAILESENRLANVAMPEAYGDTREEQLYEVALELCITWVNRVLFLKLVEAQLLRYHRGDPDYRFLDTDLISHYDALNRLFFRVLAVEPHLRAEDLQKRYRHVPYLNSSLFEPTTLEQQTLTISNLDDEPQLPLMPGTILSGPDGKRLKGKLPTLHYLLRFLDAFDFSSEGSEAIQEENKTLINAAVLGLIFEKINGYRDGAFFTPAFITMYMARDVLRETVLARFNSEMGIGAANFTELANYSTRMLSAEELLRMNEVVNSIRICDPAVGSGHFLVSCLNELIAIKSELYILCDNHGRRLPIHCSVAQDELHIKLQNDGSYFEYNPGDPESQQIQKALFHEKQTLIENCLFGVDINPNSAHICRLTPLDRAPQTRLLQKHSNARRHLSSPSGGGWLGAGGGREKAGGGGSYVQKRELETLPNIDINIKTGNSLVGRFAIAEAGTRDLLPKDKNFLRKLMVQYTLVVQGYKQA